MSNLKILEKVWCIKSKRCDEFVFSYRTYQGNEKKAFFTDERHAMEALKYFDNPEDFYVCKI